jgi:hypothetical protein
MKQGWIKRGLTKKKKKNENMMRNNVLMFSTDDIPAES